MKTPLELVQSLLSNPTNIEHVRGLTTEDVTYVSLNFDIPELRKAPLGRYKSWPAEYRRRLQWYRPRLGDKGVRGQRRSRQ
jgi:hypothetical protein